MQRQARVAVVTGASSGIGAATTAALAAAGWRVVAVARRAERLAELAATDARIVAHVADVTSLDDVVALAARVERDFAACHLLVNNAGAGLGRQFRSLADVPGVEAALDVNFLGTVRCMAAFADLLRASAPSQVVNVASVAGKVAIAAPGYAASKFATVGFSEAVGLDWAADDVVVTQLNPGFIRTEGFPQEALLRSRVTRRLVGEPEIVAAAILDAAARRLRERTVPRWYRPLVAARHVAAPVFWAAARRVAR